MPVGLLAAAEDGDGLDMVALMDQTQGGQCRAEGGYRAGVDDAARRAVGVEQGNGARGPDERGGGILAGFFLLCRLDYLLGGREGDDWRGAWLVSHPVCNVMRRHHTFDTVTGWTT